MKPTNLPSRYKSLLFGLLFLMPLASLDAQNASLLPASAYPGLRAADGSLLPSVAPYLGQSIKPLTLTVGADLLKKRDNFGYTGDEIRKFFSTPVALTLDETGLNTSLLKPVPAAGIHPRVLFNPEDVPLIRERLAKTKAGQSAISAIRNHIAEILTGPKAKFAADYDALAAGKEVDHLDPNVPFTMMYEAFRCLIDNDQVGGQKAAAAITTLSQISQKAVEANIAQAKKPADKNDFRVVAQGATYEGTLGLDYDFAFNFMTPAQRDTVRKSLSVASTGMTTIGCETLRTLHTGTSNWISWACRALFVVSAIEGEPGYDPSTYERFANAQANFVASIYPAGEAFEGWGKDFVFFEHMILIAKRDKLFPGHNTLATTSVRSTYNNYFLASLSPWGNSFTFCDSLASSGSKIARNADVAMYHALFPNDVAGDFIYRNEISSDYENVGVKTVNTHHPFAVMDTLCCAIFATDMNPVSWDEEFAQVTKDRPLTYFSEDTCNLITRSAWDKDALYLNYLNRAIPGGHQYCDRSHFSLYGLGRFWSIYHYGRQIHEQYLPANRSVLLADGRGPSIAEAKCVAMVDRPLATFEVTDLSVPWDYENNGLIKVPQGVEKIQNPFTYNQFRLHASPLPWMDYPIGILPDWYTSEKPDPTNKADWYRRNTVKKAFRTAGLIRGPHPYCLIVDDLQLDAAPHHYDWGMVLADDLVLGSSRLLAATPDGSQAEAILNENPMPDPKAPAPQETDRHLLVRAFSDGPLTDKSVYVDILRLPNPPQHDMEINKFHLTSDGVSPGFKVVLFPYKDGQPVPKTNLSPDHRTLTVAWPDQIDTVTFTPGEGGRTRVSISRGNQEIATTGS
jgi:hypothetical protein